MAGSAIHGQQWLPEAMQFMRDHQTELSSKPFAAFMVCITLSMANAGQYLEGLKGWMKPVRDLVCPVSEGYFAGALDFSKLPFSFNVLSMRFVVLFGMMKRIKTLRVHFAVWVGGLLLASLAAFSVYVYFNMAHGLSAAVDDSLRLSATKALASLNVDNGKINFKDSIPNGTAPTDLVERGLTIRIISHSGEVLLAFGPYRSAPVDAGSLSAAAAGHPAFWTFLDSGEGDNIRMYSIPILDNDHIVGMLQVAQSLGNIQDTLDRLLTTLLLVIPLIVGLAGFGGYFLASRALAPIDVMTRAARRISAENLSEHIQLPATDDEVGRLAATFDEMLDRLDESFKRERQFTADASHELRTPLAAMQTILSLTTPPRFSAGE